MDNEKFAKEMYAILEDYYRKANFDNDDYNKSLIERELQRHGDLLVYGGFSYIANHIEAVGRETMVRFMNDEKEGDKYIASQGMGLFMLHHSLVKAYGSKGTPALLKVLGSSDEDTAALAAYMLSSGDFAKQSSLPQLKAAYAKAYGTSCKLALALAIYGHGEKKLFKDLALQFLIQKLPFWAEQEGLNMAAKELFFVLALDIASDGRAYNRHGKANWKRKHYQ